MPGLVGVGLFPEMTVQGPLPPSSLFDIEVAVNIQTVGLVRASL